MKDLRRHRGAFVHALKLKKFPHIQVGGSTPPSPSSFYTSGSQFRRLKKLWTAMLV